MNLCVVDAHEFNPFHFGTEHDSTTSPAENELMNTSVVRRVIRCFPSTTDTMGQKASVFLNQFTVVSSLQRCVKHGPRFKSPQTLNYLKLQQTDRQAACLTAHRAISSFQHLQWICFPAVRSVTNQTFVLKWFRLVQFVIMF